MTERIAAVLVATALAAASLGGCAPARHAALPAAAGAVAADARVVMYVRQGCPYCHTVERAEPLPRIVPTRIPAQRRNAKAWSAIPRPRLFSR